jgi:Galactose-3-O-sulfotransferase
VHRADVVTSPEAATLERMLVFLHLAKTGGVTLNDIIVRNLQTGEFLVIDMPPKDESVLWSWSPAEVERALGHMTGAEVSRLRAVLGHYRFGLHRHLPRPCSQITLLRDPVERVLSYFYYDVGRGALTNADGSRPTIAEYVDRDDDLALDNYMTRILSGLPELDPPKGTTRRQARAVTGADFELAASNLASCSLVGRTECFDETLLLLRSDLRWSLSDLVYVRRNETLDRPAVSETVRRKLADMNRYDAALCDFASVHLSGRIAAYPGDFASDLSLFRALNTMHQAGAGIDDIHQVERANRSSRLVP